MDFFLTFSHLEASCGGNASATSGSAASTRTWTGNLSMSRLAGYSRTRHPAHALRGNGHTADEALLQYLSPLGWEHINLTGDYLWRSSAKIGAGKFRPLRPLQPA